MGKEPIRPFIEFREGCLALPKWCEISYAHVSFKIFPYIALPIDTTFCTLYEPLFSNDGKILKPKVGLRPD